jgi:hypothetical protein
LYVSADQRVGNVSRGPEDEVFNQGKNPSPLDPKGAIPTDDNLQSKSLYKILDFIVGLTWYNELLYGFNTICFTKC